MWTSYGWRDAAAAPLALPFTKVTATFEAGPSAPAGSIPGAFALNSAPMRAMTSDIGWRHPRCLRAQQRANAHQNQQQQHQHNNKTTQQHTQHTQRDRIDHE